MGSISHLRSWHEHRPEVSKDTTPKYLFLLTKKWGLVEKKGRETTCQEGNTHVRGWRKAFDETLQESADVYIMQAALQGLALFMHNVDRYR